MRKLVAVFAQGPIGFGHQRDGVLKVAITP